MKAVGSRVVRGLQVGAQVPTCDNSGAKLVEIISVLGHKTVKGRRDAKTGVRRLSEIDLWEISVVTFPMLPDARVTSVKAAPFRERLPTEREFERWLTRDAGLTRNEARALMRSGFKGLSDGRDAVGGPESERRLVSAIERAADAMRCNSCN